jgi:PAS domain S-box-containing protein
MTGPNDRPKDAAELRLRAEEKARVRAASSPENVEALSPEETRRTLHELRVHQIELEMQNEELRRAQVELDAARERYFDLYDLAPVGYCTVSEHGLILEANLTAANLLGTARGTLVTQPLSRFVLPEDGDIHYRHFNRLLKTRAPQAWELRLGRGAAWFWMRVEATVAEDADGRPVSRVVMSDITERKLMEEEKAELEGQNRQLALRQRQAELEAQDRQLELSQWRAELLAQQRLESVGTLASGIAHDINNLLGTVLAQSELALAELGAGLRPEEELRTIRAVAIRGSEIGRQLMTYARDESEVLELVDLSRTIEEMVELLKVSVSKHVVLETDLGKDLPAVTANPAQLRRVMMNLITNASDSIGDKDGVIRVTTRRVTAGPDWAMSNSQRLAEGDYLQVRVSDTGCGMTPETQDRVFDPLFTTKSKGHGLGLTVVHEIVHALRGAIRIVSTPGKGSTFEILLPCADHSGQPRGVVAPAREEALQYQARTILLVEDEASLRQPISKLIRRAGYSVIEAGDGSAALDLIRAHQNHIDVLILDITLPGASSREVFEEASRLRPGMRVIVSSAYSADMAAASLAGRVEHFIRKPYRLDDLMTLIRQARDD